MTITAPLNTRLDNTAECVFFISSFLSYSKIETIILLVNEQRLCHHRTCRYNTKKIHALNNRLQQYCPRVGIVGELARQKRDACSAARLLCRASRFSPARRLLRLPCRFFLSAQRFLPLLHQLFTAFGHLLADIHQVHVALFYFGQ